MRRLRRLGLSLISALGTRGLQAAISLVVVPITLHYLKAERYGLWMSVNAIVSVLTYVDQGLGAGTVQAISAADGRQDREKAAEYATTALVCHISVASAIVLAVLLCYGFVDWGQLLNVSSSVAANEAGPAVVVVFLAFGLNSVAGVAQRIYEGYQATFVNSIFQAIGSLASFGGVLLVLAAGGGLPSLIGVMALGTFLASLGSGILLVVKLRPWLRPRLRSISKAAVRELLRPAGQFLLINVILALAINADNLIISHFLGAAEVTSYAVPRRLFVVVQSLLLLGPLNLWPAYREALAKGDIDWAKKVFRRSLFVTLMVCLLVGGMLVLFGPAILRFWVGPDVRVSRLMLTGFALWTGMLTVGSTLGSLWNAQGQVGVQVKMLAMTLCLSLVGKILVVRTSGIEALPLVMCLAYGLAYLLPVLWHQWRSGEVRYEAGLT